MLDLIPLVHFYDVYIRVVKQARACLMFLSRLPVYEICIDKYWQRKMIKNRFSYIFVNRHVKLLRLYFSENHFFVSLFVLRRIAHFEGFILVWSLNFFCLRWLNCKPWFLTHHPLDWCFQVTTLNLFKHWNALFRIIVFF